MTKSSKPFFELTSADLMSRSVVSIPLGMSLREAAKRLAQASLHGAPVVDADGRCVGVLSTADVARWAVNRGASSAANPRGCRFQDPVREIKGRELVRCLLPPGACPLQRQHMLADGETVTECAEPHSIPVDWQLTDLEALPAEDVEHYMTWGAVTAEPNASISSLAQRMAENSVMRVIIVDDRQRPIGIVSGSDLIAALGAVSMNALDGPGRT